MGISGYGLFVLFVIGIGLLFLNIASVFISLRSPDIYQQQNSFEDAVILTEAELWGMINASYESADVCVEAMNTAIHQGIAHYWGEEVEKYHLSIPFYENYVLFLATRLYEWLTHHVRPFQTLFENFREPTEVLQKYEFSSYKKAIERGVGYCSQHAIVLAQVLRKKGIPSKIVYLKGHVVVTAQVDEARNFWWVADPDNGVIITHDMAAIEQQPEIIAAFYREHGYSPQKIQRLIGVYAPEGNKVYENVAAYHGKDRMYKYYLEYGAYGLKWLIPLGLICPYVRRFMKQHVRKEG